MEIYPNLPKESTTEAVRSSAPAAWWVRHQTNGPGQAGPLPWASHTLQRTILPPPYEVREYRLWTSPLNYTLRTLDPSLPAQRAPKLACRACGASFPDLPHMTACASKVYTLSPRADKRWLFAECVVELGGPCWVLPAHMQSPCSVEQSWA